MAAEQSPTTTVGQLSGTRYPILSLLLACQPTLWTHHNDAHTVYCQLPVLYLKSLLETNIPRLANLSKRCRSAPGHLGQLAGRISFSSAPAASSEGLLPAACPVWHAPLRLPHILFLQLHLGSANQMLSPGCSLMVHQQARRLFQLQTNTARQPGAD
jgi:hypothetical protein